MYYLETLDYCLTQRESKTNGSNGNWTHRGEKDKQDGGELGGGMSVPELRGKKKVVANFRPRTATATVLTPRRQSTHAQNGGTCTGEPAQHCPWYPRKEITLKPNSGILIYALTTTEGQWEHPHSSVIISLWTMYVTCKTKKILLKENIKTGTYWAL